MVETYKFRHFNFRDIELGGNTIHCIVPPCELPDQTNGSPNPTPHQEGIFFGLPKETVFKWGAGILIAGGIFYYLYKNK